MNHLLNASKKGVNWLGQKRNEIRVTIGVLYHSTKHSGLIESMEYEYMVEAKQVAKIVAKSTDQDIGCFKQNSVN